VDIEFVEARSDPEDLGEKGHMLIAGFQKIICIDVRNIAPPFLPSI